MNKRQLSPGPTLRLPEARSAVGEGRLHVPHGLKQAPVLDLMCSHFVLTLAAKQGGKFNVRRDLNGLLSLSGRHLVWPAPTLAPVTPCRRLPSLADKRFQSAKCL